MAEKGKIVTRFLILRTPYLPTDNAGTGTCNVESVYKTGNKLNSLTTRTPSSVYSMRARVSVASSAMTDLGFFDSMIMSGVNF